MKVIDLWLLAAKNVFRAGMRTALCVLAIGIGIASVTMIRGIGDAAAMGIEEQIQQIGIQGTAIYHKRGETLSKEMIEAATSITGIDTVLPFSVATGTIQLRNYRVSAAIFGIEDRLDETLHLEVLYGSLPTEQQIRAGAHIAVIDNDFARKAYGRENVVGKKLSLTIDGVREKLEICAVIRSQAAGLVTFVGGSTPHLIYLPNSTLREIKPTIKTSTLLINATAENLQTASEIVLAQLTRLYGDVFKLENISQYLDTFSAITAAVALLIGGVAAISIIVGCIGVMNTMTAAVTIRTREIGIYRALGAKKKTIVAAFLCEAILQCVMGGVCGLSLSIGCFALLKIPIITKTALTGLSVSAIGGMLFGILPALKASRLDPIQAIRNE